MTEKYCHHHCDERKEKLKKIGGIALLVAIVVVLAFFIGRAIVNPRDPNFILQDVTIQTFNVTGPTLNSYIQITVLARNPNDKLGVYYDRLKAYAAYHDQQITLPSIIPPTYQDTHGMSIWSPFLNGQNVPIAPYIGASINQDVSMGGVQLVVKLDGKIRYKLDGTVFTGPTHHLHVKCTAVIPLGNSNVGVVLGNNAVKYQLLQSCNVDA